MRVVVVVSLVFAAAPILAQDGDFTEARPAPGKVESFAAIDRNADDMLDWEEVRNMTSRLFTDADADGSGSLDAQEFAFGEEHWKLADADGDGKVTRRELEAHAAAVFAGGDGDGDGKLSREEAKMTRDKEGLN